MPPKVRSKQGNRPRKQILLFSQIHTLVFAPPLSVSKPYRAIIIPLYRFNPPFWFQPSRWKVCLTRHWLRGSGSPALPKTVPTGMERELRSSLSKTLPRRREPPRTQEVNRPRTDRAKKLKLSSESRAKPLNVRSSLKLPLSELLG